MLLFALLQTSHTALCFGIWQDQDDRGDKNRDLQVRSNVVFPEFILSTVDLSYVPS